MSAKMGVMPEFRNKWIAEGRGPYGVDGHDELDRLDRFDELDGLDDVTGWIFHPPGLPRWIVPFGW